MSVNAHFSEPVDGERSAVLDTQSKTKKAKKRKYGTLKKSEPESPLSCVSSISSHSCYDNLDHSVEPLEKKLAITRADKVTVFGENDIRGKYADIFCEAFNDFDKTSFAQLMRDHCEESLVVVYEYVGVNPYGTPNYIEVRGFDTVVVFWDGLLTAIPDSLFQVHHTKYKVLPNEYTSIVCSFSFVGTKVYELKGISEENKEQNVVVSLSPGGTTTGALQDPDSQLTVTAYKSGHNDQDNTSLSSGEENNGKRNLMPTDEVHEESFAAPVLVERSELISKKITIIGTLTYYVNPNKKIYQMSFVHSMKL